MLILRISSQLRHPSFFCILFSLAVFDTVTDFARETIAFLIIAKTMYCRIGTCRKFIGATIFNAISEIPLSHHNFKGVILEDKDFFWGNFVTFPWKKSTTGSIFHHYVSLTVLGRNLDIFSSARLKFRYRLIQTHNLRNSFVWYKES